MTNVFREYKANEKKFGNYADFSAKGVFDSASSMVDLIGGRFANIEAEKNIGGLGASGKFVQTSADLVGMMKNGQYAVTDLKVHAGDPKLQDWLQVAEEMKFVKELVDVYNNGDGSENVEALQKKLLAARFGGENSEQYKQRLAEGGLYTEDQLKELTQSRRDNPTDWLIGNLFVGNGKGGAAEYQMTYQSAMQFLKAMTTAREEYGRALTEEEAAKLAGVPGQMVGYRNLDPAKIKRAKTGTTRKKIDHEKERNDLAEKYNKLLKEQLDLEMKIKEINDEKNPESLYYADKLVDVNKELSQVTEKIDKETKKKSVLSKSADGRTKGAIALDERIQRIDELHSEEKEYREKNLEEKRAEEHEREQERAYREALSVGKQNIGISGRIDLLRRKLVLTQSKREKDAIESEIEELKYQLENDPQFSKSAYESLLSKVDDDSKRDEIENKLWNLGLRTSSKNITQSKGQLSVFDNVSERIVGSTKRFLEYGISAKLLAAIPKYFKNIIETGKQLDEALTNIRVVTGYNMTQAQGLMKTYNDLAKQLGTTTQAVAQSANQWLRQGYSIAEVNDLIKASTYLAKLGQIDAGQATQYLTSTLKGFKMEAREATNVVSILTKLDQKFAVSASGVAEALSKTAVSAQLAGVDLEQIAAMVTTVGDVSQASMDSVGSAFKTLFARYGNVKAGVFQSLTDSSEESTSALNDIEKVLGAVGIQVRSSAMQFRDFDDVLAELADKWITLSNVEKNAVSTALGGTRQREQVNILLENYDKYQDALEQARNSKGSAEEKYGAVEESVAYSLNQVKAAWEGIVQQMNTNPIFTTMAKGMKLVYEWGMKLVPLFAGMFGAQRGPGMGETLKNWFLGGKGILSKTSIFDIKGSIFERQKATTETQERNQEQTQTETITQKIDQVIEHQDKTTQAVEKANNQGTGENEPNGGNGGKGKNRKLWTGGKGAAIGAVVGGITSAALSDWTHEDNTKGIVNTVSGIASGALSALGPFGMLAGAVISIVNGFF